VLEPSLHDPKSMGLFKKHMCSGPLNQDLCYLNFFFKGHATFFAEKRANNASFIASILTTITIVGKLRSWFFWNKNIFFNLFLSKNTQ